MVSASEKPSSLDLPSQLVEELKDEMVKDEDKAVYKEAEEEVEVGGSCRQGVWMRRVPAGRSRGPSLQPDKLRPPEPRRSIGPLPSLPHHLRDAVGPTLAGVLTAGLLLYTL